MPKKEKFSTNNPKDKRTMQQKVADAQELPPIPRAAIKMILLNTDDGIEEWSFAVGANEFKDYTKLLPLINQEGNFVGELTKKLSELGVDEFKRQEVVDFVLELRDRCILTERDRLWKHAINVEAGISGGFLDPHGVKLNKEEQDETNAASN